MMLPGAAQHERRIAFASGRASPEPAPKEELLGGELVVKIEDATVESPCHTLFHSDSIAMPCDCALSLAHRMAVRGAQLHLTHSNPY